jgi:rsbT antagonist protein RsbS
MTDRGARIPLQLAQQCVVASIQVDLDDRVLAAFRAELLEFLRRSGARGVILDLSGAAVMDREEFGALRDTMRMALLMGATTIVSGMRPGVVSALIDLEADTDGVLATATLDDAFDLMRETQSDRHRDEEDEVGEVDEPLEGTGAEAVQRDETGPHAQVSASPEP